MSTMVQNSRHPLHNTAARLSKDFNNLEPFVAPTSDHVEDAMGKLSLTNDHEVYIGSSHWATILEDVSVLRGVH